MADTAPSPPPTPTSELQLGSTLGSYELVELLGKGAMGRVYRGRHVLLGREVAVKILNSEAAARPDMVERFFREARIVNEIDHENIVEVTDFVEQNGLAYLVMELLDGTSLRDMMRQKGRKYPPIKQMVAIVVQICDALEAAHEKGVVHRDLKPDNVFVSSRDGEDFVKVLDFGVAKLRDPDESMKVTETSAGMILGTPHYMAPEQALGREVDRQTDVWATGVVLYEMLAGTVPFKANSFVELAMQIREQPARALPARTPRGERIPPWLSSVVFRCLEKKAADRYKSMAALAEALAGPGGSPRARFVPAVLRGPARAAAILAAAIVLAVWLRVPDRVRSVVAAVSRSVQSTTDLAAGAPDPARSRAPAPPAAPAAPAGKAAAAAPTPPAETAPVPSPEPAPKRLAPAGQTAPAKSATPAKTPGPAKREGSAERDGAPAKREAPSERDSSSTARTRSGAHATSERPHVPTVELHLLSTPPGARVVRLDTGEKLGRTPVHVNVAKKSATVWIQMTFEGHRPIKFAVDLRRDNTANVSFQSVKKTTSRGR